MLPLTSNMIHTKLYPEILNFYLKLYLVQSMHKMAPYLSNRTFQNVVHMIAN